LTVKERTVFSGGADKSIHVNMNRISIDEIHLFVVVRSGV